MIIEPLKRVVKLKLMCKGPTKWKIHVLCRGSVVSNRGQKHKAQMFIINVSIK